MSLRVVIETVVPHRPISSTTCPNRASKRPNLREGRRSSNTARMGFGTCDIAQYEAGVNAREHRGKQAELAPWLTCAQVVYCPAAALVRMVAKSMGDVTYVKYPGAMASVTGLAKTPYLSFLQMVASTRVGVPHEARVFSAVPS
jgi:hypothetical protein